MGRVRKMEKIKRKREVEKMEGVREVDKVIAEIKKMRW